MTPYDGAEAVGVEATGLAPEALTDLAVDLWRLHARVRSLAATLAEGPEPARVANERVLAACERTEDRLRRLGFEVRVLEGSFDANERARTVEHEPAPGPLHVVACLSPAVYHGGRLLREADIVTRGGEAEIGGASESGGSESGTIKPEPTKPGAAKRTGRGGTRGGKLGRAEGEAEG